MKQQQWYVWLAVVLVCSPLFGKQKSGEPVEHVDPFIGTGKSVAPTRWGIYGGTYPGAVAPFGLVQVTPETRATGDAVGYISPDSTIRYFTFLGHQSGYPNGSTGYFPVMPVGAGQECDSIWENVPFRRSTEHATAGYYTVELERPRVRVECTATQRVGVCRFTMRDTGSFAVLFPATDSLEIGERGFAGRYAYVAYRAEFSTALESVKRVARGLLVTFRDRHVHEVEMKVAFSLHGIRQAGANLIAEVPDLKFDAVREQTRRIWNGYLQRCEVEGGTKKERTVFYTALYHALLLPHVVSDAGAERTTYAGFSPWDTYHTLHPLQALICPDETGDMVASLVQTAVRTGRLFRGPMAGNHAVAIVLDAYRKGIRSYDAAQAYEGVRRTVSTPGRRQQDMGSYIAHGYVPARYPESVSRTLDYAYDDWVAGEFARDLGKTEESAFFLERSLGYRHLFNADRRLMMARDTLGAWVPFGGYQEGDIWSVSWCVQHNIQDLINMMGGRHQFTTNLDSVFVGGRYLHDNEPPMHYAYLFNYAGAPWRTQYHVREIMDRSYGTGPGGIPGNDDLGSLSSWYVFSAMGLYPVCPGEPSYNIGTPLFEKTTIHLRNGHDLVIRADGASGERRYISAASLNGARHDRPWFRHSDIVDGGLLRLTMRSMPDTTWGAGIDAAPLSLTTGSPAFAVSDLSVKPVTVYPHEEVPVTVRVQNTGARGALGLHLYVDGSSIARAMGDA